MKLEVLKNKLEAAKTMPDCEKKTAVIEMLEEQIKALES